MNDKSTDRQSAGKLADALEGQARTIRQALADPDIVVRSMVELACMGLGSVMTPHQVRHLVRGHEAAQ